VADDRRCLAALGGSREYVAAADDRECTGHFVP
jgi:hypothetical protein